METIRDALDEGRMKYGVAVRAKGIASCIEEGRSC